MTDTSIHAVTPCLWFADEAQAAAELYTSLFPNSRIDRIDCSPADYPSGKEGDVLTVSFTVNGTPFLALNGGDADFAFNESVSFIVDCADQAEVDRYWDALTRDGGEASQCGWLKDRYGLSWQIVPRQLNELFQSPDRKAARRAMAAMLEMQKLDIREMRRAYDGEGVTS